MDTDFSQLSDRTQQIAAETAIIVDKLRVAGARLRAKKLSKAELIELCAGALAASEELSATANSIIRLLQRPSAATRSVEWLTLIANNDQDILDEINVALAFGGQKDETLRALRTVLRKVSQNARRDNAKKGAESRHSRDPKQDAKEFIRQCWSDWRGGRTEYDNPTKFAEDMLQKFPDLLKSERVITGWVRDWDRAAKTASRQEGDAPC